MTLEVGVVMNVGTLNAQSTDRLARGVFNAACCPVHTYTFIILVFRLRYWCAEWFELL